MQLSWIHPTSLIKFHIHARWCRIEQTAVWADWVGCCVDLIHIMYWFNDLLCKKIYSFMVWWCISLKFWKENLDFSNNGRCKIVHVCRKRRKLLALTNDEYRIFYFFYFLRSFNSYNSGWDLNDKFFHWKYQKMPTSFKWPIVI